MCIYDEESCVEVTDLTIKIKDFCPIYHLNVLSFSQHSYGRVEINYNVRSRTCFIQRKCGKNMKDCACFQCFRTTNDVVTVK